ncbi:hypothetical protein D3C79_1027400 [compost metagenome]
MVGVFFYPRAYFEFGQAIQAVERSLANRLAVAGARLAHLQRGGQLAGALRGKMTDQCGAVRAHGLGHTPPNVVDVFGDASC